MQEEPRSTPERPLRLFEGYGVELEYMIVDAESLDVVPCADQLLEAVAGEPTDEHLAGEIAWNNELALHVIELKCNGPKASLEGLAAQFQANVNLANETLAKDGRRLMPGAMHPWMDPLEELELWPHGSGEIYQAFDRVFGCRGHGWANLQSAHLNLPFANDEEFARLSAAVRFLLPILPALCASSPVMDGRINGTADNRLAVYRTNCAKIPSVTGDVVPEPVYGIEEYRDLVLGRIYRDLEPYEPQGVLLHEWVNARGAIPRFDRMALEIRVLDVQECPAADLARARVIVETLKGLIEEAWCDLERLAAWPQTDLIRILGVAQTEAERAVVGDRSYLRALGMNRGEVTLAALWERLFEHVAARSSLDDEAGRMLEHYLREGSLATRIVRALPEAPQRAELARVYARLCTALAQARPFSSNAESLG